MLILGGTFHSYALFATSVFSPVHLQTHPQTQINPLPELYYFTFTLLYDGFLPELVWQPPLALLTI
jgi:hypothetical protein